MKKTSKKGKKSPSKEDLKKPIKVKMTFEKLLNVMTNPVPATNQGK